MQCDTFIDACKSWTHSLHDNDAWEIVWYLRINQKYSFSRLLWQSLQADWTACSRNEPCEWWWMKTTQRNVWSVLSSDYIFSRSSHQPSQDMSALSSVDHEVSMQAEDTFECIWNTIVHSSTRKQLLIRCEGQKKYTMCMYMYIVELQ